MPIRLHSQPSDPFATLEHFRQEIDRMFGAPAPAPRSCRSPGGRWSAPANIYETDGALVVRLPVAGIDPANIEVTVEDGTLRIEAERVNDAPEGAYHRAERARGRVVRVLALPARVDADEVSATYRDGILDVVLPTTGGPRRIEVQTA